ncbi:hypothetical protein [Rhodomicrobium sp. R_RK_3]|nr:hypothetical protein [Rhodomicrobium sp. R_RK_3]
MTMRKRRSGLAEREFVKPQMPAPERPPRGNGRTGDPLRAAAGWLCGWPWLDPAAHWALRRWFFPLSRLWAAGTVAEGSPERFYEAVPAEPRPGQRDRLVRLLARLEEARVRAEAVDAAWHRALFDGIGTGGGAASETECMALETARLAARQDHNGLRRQFRFLITPATPRVNFDPPTPAEVDAVYGAALADPAPYFAPPDPMPELTRTRAIPTAKGRDFWISFDSPSGRLADRVHARVYEPDGVTDPPTLIFGHGICIEFDHWRGLIDEVGALRARGIRVIRPEAPWHGRRRTPGHYGGERMISTFPMGSLDLMTGAVREWSVLADWARKTSSGPLAFGGSSLGALTAQLAADRARDWPARLQPEALLLIAHCGTIQDAVRHGDLMRIWGGREIVEAKGWRPEPLEDYLALLAPSRGPVTPPERIVTVLGKRDRVTPYASGADAIDRWHIPDANRFIWDRGHFSIPVTMMRDPAPLDRFCALMRESG